MANPFINMFAAMRQNDIFSLDNLTRSLMAQPEQPQQGQVPPEQAMMAQQGQQPQQQFPANPGMGVQPMPAVTGNGPNVWQQPSDEQMGYNQPASDRPTSITGRLYQGMLERGIPEHVAAGFMMNGQDESGFNLTAIGDNGNAKGWLQWNGPRKQQFEEMFGGDWSMDNQLDFLKWELDNTERGARDKIFATQTPGEAAAAIVQHFERPAKEHEIRRVNKYLGGGGADWMSSMGYDVGDINYEELEAEDEVDPEELKKYNSRQRQSMALMAIGKGLGQMSRGHAIDISDVVESYHDRQAEMRERISEMQQERIRRAERQQGLQIDASRYAQTQAFQGLLQEDAQAAAAAQQEDTQAAAAELQAGRQAFEAKENTLTRAHDTSEREGGQDFQLGKSDLDRNREAEALRIRYEGKPWYDELSRIAVFSPEVAAQMGEDYQTREDAAIKDGIAEESNERIATMMESQGSPDAAALAREGDYIRASEIFLAQTKDNSTTDMLNAEYIAANPDKVGDFLTAKRAELLTPPEQLSLDYHSTRMNEQGERMIKIAEMRGLYDQAMQIALRPDFAQGKFNAALLGTQELLADLGFSTGQQVTQAELFKSITNRLIPYMRTAGEGVMTDADATRYEESLQKLGNTREANIAMIQMYDYLAQVEQARHSAEFKYLSTTGNDLGDLNSMNEFTASELQRQNLAGGPFQTFSADMPDAQLLQSVEALPEGTAYYVRNADNTYKLLISGEE